MRKLLIILFLLSAFLFYASAGQEEEKGKVVIIDPDDTNMIENWPQWLFLHGYTSYYDSNWSTGKGSGAIVIRKPPSFGESFAKGFSKGISMGVDNYFREKEYKRYTEAMIGLIKLKRASEGYYSKPKDSQPHEYRNEYRMSPEEKQANLDRIEELDRIIEQKHKKREKLNEYLKSVGLPKMPDGFVPEWMYWTGKEWARKKQEK